MNSIKMIAVVFLVFVGGCATSEKVCLDREGSWVKLDDGTTMCLNPKMVLLRGDVK